MDLTILGKVVSEQNPNANTRIWYVRRYPFSVRITVGNSGSLIEILTYFGSQLIYDETTASTNPQNIVNAMETKIKNVYSESLWYTA